MPRCEFGRFEKRRSGRWRARYHKKEAVLGAGDVPVQIGRLRMAIGQIDRDQQGARVDPEASRITLDDNQKQAWSMR